MRNNGIQDCQSHLLHDKVVGVEYLGRGTTILLVPEEEEILDGNIFSLLAVVNDRG